jgi:acyl-CoA thioesterase-1
MDKRKKESAALRFFPFPVSLFSLLFFIFALAACGDNDNLLSKESEPGMMNDKSKAPVMYVALGDSTGVGVGAKDGGYVARLFQRIERERPGARLINLCVSGATSGDVLRAQLSPAIKARPTFVTIGIGINDVGRGFPEETFAQNFEEIVSRIKNETGATIVVTNLPDISLAPAVPTYLRDEVHTRIVSFNARLKEIAERHGAIVVDAYTTTREVIPTHPEFFSDDGFHPSDTGYEYWAKEMWPTIKSVLEK